MLKGAGTNSRLGAMGDLIAQNPVLAYLALVAAIVAGTWKVFHELYVKPRDFRIDSLKEQLGKLITELDERRNHRRPAARGSRIRLSLLCAAAPGGPVILTLKIVMYFALILSLLLLCAPTSAADFTPDPASIQRLRGCE